jgi:2-dehydro-3-deoxy-D-arabinonate dehydratase
LEIRRAGKKVFNGQTQLSRIKRSFDELASYLYSSQALPKGAVLLTGTGIVPPDDFTLEDDDTVHIRISGIGALENPVCIV